MFPWVREISELTPMVGFDQRFWNTQSSLELSSSPSRPLTRSTSALHDVSITKDGGPASSLSSEHRLQTRRLSSCGSRAQSLRGMWDLPRPGLEPWQRPLAKGCPGVERLRMAPEENLLRTLFGHKKLTLNQRLFMGASLVAQWLRICLPMQGTRVRALVWEDPTCRGATGPVSHNY
ncbi:hypothetical protein J1605_022171 [Eschrichtius robustus]|uniref:Uncharacterized protein n=1 Tax=Eschrichtius robustus TaxID=9764 RepID=A0AB34H8U7_ESCRO|nr:hypothetical protein J1605_022171 [Eschrichtius robustus]